MFIKQNINLLEKKHQKKQRKLDILLSPKISHTPHHKTFEFM